MADIPARTELEGHHRPDPRQPQDPCRRRSAWRCARSTSSRRSGEPPLRVYDTSGPYTDPEARIDIMAGLPELRRDWIRARGDVEEIAPARGPARGQRPARPRPLGRRPALPQRPPQRAARASPARNVSQMHYARRGIITPEMEYVADARESRAASSSPTQARDGQDFGASIPDLRHPRIRPRRGRPRPRDHPQQHQPPRSRADGDRPQLPGQDQRQYRQLAPSPPTSPPKSTRWSGRSAGAPTR